MLLHEDVDWKTNKAWRANKDCIVRRENGTVLLFSLHKIIGPNRTNRSHQHKPTKHSQAEFAVASDPPLLQLVLSSLMPKNIKTCENPSFVSIDEMWDERIHIAITTWCHEECTGNNQNNSIMIMCNASTCFFFCLLLMKSSCLHVLPPPSLGYEVLVFARPPSSQWLLWCSSCRFLLSACVWKKEFALVSCKFHVKRQFKTKSQPRPFLVA